MSVTTYRPVSWQPLDLGSRAKFELMASNDQWLFDNTMQGVYRANGLTRTEGLKLVTGIAVITTTKLSHNAVEVRFPNVFSSASRPTVVLGVNSDFERRIFCTYNGLGDLQPDHRGFRIHVQMDSPNKKKNIINKKFLVHWTAIGF